MQIVVLSREDILLLHDLILSVSPGRPGILHVEVIDAALQRPYTYMQYADTDIHTVAALSIDSLARNHAFYDGNKRTALMCAIYVYAVNGIYLDVNLATNADFEELVLWVVKDKPEIDEIRGKLIELVKKYRLSSLSLFLGKLKSHFDV